MKTFLCKIKSYHLIIETTGYRLTLVGEKERIRLRPKVSEVFQFLLESAIKTPETVVTKDELINKFWPETPDDPDKFVEPNNLDKAISGVRGALKKIVGDNNIIEPVRGKGYRLVPDVKKIVRQASVGPSDKSRDLVITNDELEGVDYITFHGERAAQKPLAELGKHFLSEFPLIPGSTPLGQGKTQEELAEFAKVYITAMNQGSTAGEDSVGHDARLRQVPIPIARFLDDLGKINMDDEEKAPKELMKVCKRHGVRCALKRYTNSKFPRNYTVLHGYPGKFPRVPK